MALEIRYKFAQVGKQGYHKDEVHEYPFPDIPETENIIWLKINGYERVVFERIFANVPSIPIPKCAFILYRGEMAQFIYDILLINKPQKQDANHNEQTPQIPAGENQKGT